MSSTEVCLKIENLPGFVKIYLSTAAEIEKKVWLSSRKVLGFKAWKLTPVLMQMAPEENKSK